MSKLLTDEQAKALDGYMRFLKATFKNLDDSHIDNMLTNKLFTKDISIDWLNEMKSFLEKIKGPEISGKKISILAAGEKFTLNKVSEEGKKKLAMNFEHAPDRTFEASTIATLKTIRTNLKKDEEIESARKALEETKAKHQQELDAKDEQHEEELQNLKAEENARRNEDAAALKHKYQEQARPDAPERQEEQTQTQLNDPINNRALNSKYSSIIQEAARQRMPTDVLFDYFVDKGVPADHIKGVIQQTRTQESNDLLRKGLYERVMMRPEILENLSGDDKAGYYTSNTKFTEPSRQSLPLPINYQDPESHAPVPKRWLTRRMYWQVKNM